MTIANSITVDPITTEIIRNAMISAAEDMNETLIRSAYTPIIYEMKDCAVALLDADHRILGESTGLPIFLGNLAICTRITERTFGRTVWHPGDVWIMNDSYLTGTHLNDQTVFAPIFYGDDLVGFAASRAHWLDVGAKDPGGPMNSTDIYQEGLRLGPTKVVERGVERADVISIITTNGRFPYSATGDLRAQIAVTLTGERRLGAILDRFGPERVHAACELIFAQSERLDRTIVGSIPDGVYEAEGCIDNDGLSDDPYWVRVRAEIAGEEMVIDLSQSSDAAPGPINCGEAQAISACRVAYKALINPDQPVSGGTFRNLRVLVRKGSFLAAQEPSPCQWYHTPLGLLIDLVIKALSPVMPNTAAAACYGDAMVIILSGTDDRSGRQFLHIEPTVGGWGAWNGSDGESGMINKHNGSFRDVPTEVFETKYPIRLSHYGFRPDSGGPGRWRGGVGVVREYTILCQEAYVSLWFDRSKMPAFGLSGGRHARPPTVTINPGRRDERTVLKANRIPLRRGDVIRCETGGGGGFGDPLERDEMLVLADLAAGMITPTHAQAHYGWIPEQS